MRAVAVAAFWLSMTLAAAAAPAATPANVFRAFGLFGTWAVDCGRPASPQNPYVSDFLEDNGAVVEEHHLGTDYAVNHYHVLSAKGLSATKVALEVVFRPGSEAGHHQKLVMRVANGHRRTLFNQPQGDKVRVKDGVVLGLGVKTPTLTKCE
jgi:hypothetical protein